MTETTDRAGRGARGADDIDLAAKLGRAIRAAMGDEVSQGELARRTGIDQPTISKLVRGIRPTPLNVWEMLAIERATNRPAGFILQHAGLLPRSADAESALRAEPELSSTAREVLLAGLRAAKAENTTTRS